MSGNFDADTFMHTEVEGQLETKLTPPPEDEYNAYVEDVEATELGGSPALAITYNVTDEAVKELLGMEKVTVRDNLFLDLDEQGRLEFGPNKNVKLGALREAVNQNDGSRWAPSMLVGQGPVRIKVTHRFNKTTGEGPYANVARVTAA